MRKLLLIGACLLVVNTISAQVSFVGSWKGALDGVRELKMAFNISDSSGVLKATLDVPAQGAEGLPCTGVRVDRDSIHIDMKMLNGKYDGKLTGVNKIDGLWTQNGLSIALKLERKEGKIVLNRPQTPKPPFPYKNEDIGFYSRDKSMKFGGTLTAPDDDKKHPAILMITGSGPQNRDEELFQHKPFAVVADYLTRHGYVVLRVDDRGVGNTGGDRAVATSADYSKDAEECLAYLKGRKEVDKKKIGLYGHSEGGMIAEMIAAENKDVDFIILMAAPGIKGTDLMTEQSVHNAIAMGLDEDIAEQYGKLYHSIVEDMTRSTSRDAFTNAINKDINEWKKGRDSVTILMTTGIKDSATQAMFVQEFVDAAWNKWMVYLMQYDPQPVLEKISCKVLALDGDKDIQVISRSNLEGIAKALAKSRSKVHEEREIPGVNHLFQECKTCTVREYGQLEQTIKPEVLEIITQWLDEHVK